MRGLSGSVSVAPAFAFGPRQAIQDYFNHGKLRLFPYHQTILSYTHCISASGLRPSITSQGDRMQCLPKIKFAHIAQEENAIKVR